MSKQAWSEKHYLQAWVERATVHLDFVASWETLLGIYESLSFIDPINDNIRMTEFKWIIAETNKFLTRMRTNIVKAKDVESAVEYLSHQFNTKEAKDITDRQTLAYNKLKQQWINNSIYQLRAMLDELEAEGEEEDD